MKGNTKKATEQLCEITQSPLFRLVFACILISFNFLILCQIETSRTFSENEGSEQIQQTLRYNVHKNLAECYNKSGDLLLAEDHFFQVRRT